MTEIRKLVRNGKVAIVVCKQFTDNGWYSYHNRDDLIFLPELIRLIESLNHVKKQLPGDIPGHYLWKYKKIITEITNRTTKLQEFVNDICNQTGSTYVNVNDLVVEWIPVNTRFKIVVQTIPKVITTYIRDYEDQEAAYQSNDVEEEGGYNYEVVLLDDDTWITA